MNGAYYRLNIRFDLTDKRQWEIVERLQALDKKQYGSISNLCFGTAAAGASGCAYAYRRRTGEK